MRWRPNATSTTILHVCVIHDQPAIFEQLVTQHNAQLHLRNAWHQTPLLAAASQGSLQSFEMSLGCVGRTLWEFGEVWSFVYPLLEIDTQFEKDNDHLPSVLRTLVEHKRLHHLGVRQIRSLIRDKWRRGAQLVFYLQLIVFILVLVLLTLCAAPPHKDHRGLISEVSPYYYALIGTTGLLGLMFLPPPQSVASAGYRSTKAVWRRVRAYDPHADGYKPLIKFIRLTVRSLSIAVRRFAGLNTVLRLCFSTRTFVFLVMLSIPLHPGNFPAASPRPSRADQAAARSLHAAVRSAATSPSCPFATRTAIDGPRGFSPRTRALPPSPPLPPHTAAPVHLHPAPANTPLQLAPRGSRRPTWPSASAVTRTWHPSPT